MICTKLAKLIDRVYLAEVFQKMDTKTTSVKSMETHAISQKKKTYFKSVKIKMLKNTINIPVSHLHKKNLFELHL